MPSSVAPPSAAVMRSTQSTRTGQPERSKRRWPVGPGNTRPASRRDPERPRRGPSSPTGRRARIAPIPPPVRAMSAAPAPSPARQPRIAPITPEHPGLDDDHPPDLAAGHPGRAQDADLAHPLDDVHRERVDDPEAGHDDRHDRQGVEETEDLAERVADRPADGVEGVRLEGELARRRLEGRAGRRPPRRARSAPRTSRRRGRRTGPSRPTSRRAPSRRPCRAASARRSRPRAGRPSGRGQPDREPHRRAEARARAARPGCAAG